MTPHRGLIHIQGYLTGRKDFWVESEPASEPLSHPLGGGGGAGGEARAKFLANESGPSYRLVELCLSLGKKIFVEVTFS